MMLMTSSSSHYCFTNGIVLLLILLSFTCSLQRVSTAPAPSSSENVNHALEKIGILDAVLKVSALLLPPAFEKPPADADEEEVVTYGQNPIHPECPSTCLQAWVGDGWCDTECSLDTCGKDGGDCEGWCAPDCKPEWVGDGFCDIDCFRKECEWDKTDCASNFTMTQLQVPLPKHKKFDYSKCPEACDKTLLHDGGCDEECNVLECNFDGGDCAHQCAPNCANAWLGDGDCDPACNVGKCGFDKGDCKICTPGCEPGMVGNGICDRTCDVQDCESDAGDCYGVCWVSGKIDYEKEPFFYPHCRNEWKGDGYCDCFCMNDACNFDHGDCKGVDCSVEFALLKQLNARLNVTEYPFPEINETAWMNMPVITEMTARRLSFPRSHSQQATSGGSSSRRSTPSSSSNSYYYTRSFFG